MKLCSLLLVCKGDHHLTLKHLLIHQFKATHTYTYFQEQGETELLELEKKNAKELYLHIKELEALMQIRIKAQHLFYQALIYGNISDLQQIQPPDVKSTEDLEDFIVTLDNMNLSTVQTNKTNIKKDDPFVFFESSVITSLQELLLSEDVDMGVAKSGDFEAFVDDRFYLLNREDVSWYKTLTAEFHDYKQFSDVPLMPLTKEGGAHLQKLEQLNQLLNNKEEERAFTLAVTSEGLLTTFFKMKNDNNAVHFLESAHYDREKQHLLNNVNRHIVTCLDLCEFRKLAGIINKYDSSDYNQLFQLSKQLGAIIDGQHASHTTTVYHNLKINDIHDFKKVEGEVQTAVPLNQKMYIDENNQAILARLFKGALYSIPSGDIEDIIRIELEKRTAEGKCRICGSKIRTGSYSHCFLHRSLKEKLETITSKRGRYAIGILLILTLIIRNVVKEKPTEGFGFFSPYYQDGVRIIEVSELMGLYMYFSMLMFSIVLLGIPLLIWRYISEGTFD